MNLPISPIKNHHRTCQLLLQQATQNFKSPEPLKDPSNNIFLQHLPDYVGQDQMTRPVGGASLISKIQHKLKKQHKIKLKSLATLESTQPQNKLSNKLQTEISNSNTQKKKNKSAYKTIDPNQQTLKEHRIYSKSSRSLEPKTDHNGSLPRIKEKGVDKQTRIFVQKSAVLDEITYSQPLAQHSGNKYFQYLLRDNWKEQLKKPAFIYQIGPASKHNEFITKMKKYRPQLREKIRMVLKGRSLSSI